MHKMKDQYMLRLPDGWRDALKATAAINRRSMNQEILAAVEPVVAKWALDQAMEKQNA